MWSHSEVPGTRLQPTNLGDTIHPSQAAPSSPHFLAPTHLAFPAGSSYTHLHLRISHHAVQSRSCLLSRPGSPPSDPLCQPTPGCQSPVLCTPEPPDSCAHLGLVRDHSSPLKTGQWSPVHLEAGPGLCGSPQAPAPRHCTPADAAAASPRRPFLERPTGANAGASLPSVPLPSCPEVLPPSPNQPCISFERLDTVLTAPAWEWSRAAASAVPRSRGPCLYQWQPAVATMTRDHALRAPNNRACDPQPEGQKPERVSLGQTLGVTGLCSLGRLQGHPSSLSLLAAQGLAFRGSWPTSVFGASHGGQSWSRGIPLALCEVTCPAPTQGNPGKSPGFRAGCLATVIPSATSLPLGGAADPGRGS